MEHPEWLRYRTSNYERSSGIYVADRRLQRIDDEARYDVLIDATLDDTGSLTYGERVVPGRGGGELLVSTYVCHPATANDNTAGIGVAAMLPGLLPPGRLRFDVRFLFTPSGIGTLTGLQRNEDRLARVVGGVVLACAGDRARSTTSRLGAATPTPIGPPGSFSAPVPARRCAMSCRGEPTSGSSGRRASDLPVGTLTRTPNGGYPEHPPRPTTWTCSSRRAWPTPRS